jgi:hypothetical protein
VSDLELRARAREVEESPDDEVAARAWVAAAERSGDAAALCRALGHHARLGDVTSYEKLARRTPWPRAQIGLGDTLHLRSDDPALPLMQPAELLSAEPPVRIRLGRTATEAVDPEGKALWSAPPQRIAALASTGFVGLEGNELQLRDTATGAVRAASDLVAWASIAELSVEHDRALLASRDGGAFCLDLDPLSFGKILWDTRPREPGVREYSPAGSYIVGDRIHHKKFGEGTVARLAGTTRILVYFQDDERTLAHAGAPSDDKAELTQTFHRTLLAGSVALLEDEKSVTALDARTGAFRFQTKGTASLCAADARGVVTFSRRDAGGRTTKGGLTELDPMTGDERYFFPGSSVSFVALGERVLLASRVRRKGWVDREAERELVALDRDDRAKLLWRADEPVVLLVTATRAYFDRQRSVDLFTGR